MESTKRCRLAAVRWQFQARSRRREQISSTAPVQIARGRKSARQLPAKGSCRNVLRRKNYKRLEDSRRTRRRFVYQVAVEGERWRLNRPRQKLFCKATLCLSLGWRGIKLPHPVRRRWAHRSAGRVRAPGFYPLREDHSVRPEIGRAHV